MVGGMARGRGPATAPLAAPCCCCRSTWGSPPPPAAVPPPSQSLGRAAVQVSASSSTALRAPPTSHSACRPSPGLRTMRPLIPLANGGAGSATQSALPDLCRAGCWEGEMAGCWPPLSPQRHARRGGRSARRCVSTGCCIVAWLARTFSAHDDACGPSKHALQPRPSRPPRRRPTPRGSGGSGLLLRRGGGAGSDGGKYLSRRWAGGGGGGQAALDEVINLGGALVWHAVE